MTRQLAEWAGISPAVAQTIAEAANKPDEDASEPVSAFVFYLSNITSKNEGAQQEAKRRMALVKEWHFPSDRADGRVDPGNIAARMKATIASEEGGGQEGSLIDFGRAMHVLQDSYAHQGMPVIKGMGHSRMTVEVTELQYEGFISYIAGEGFLSRVHSGKYRLHVGNDSALDHSADNPLRFPANARAAALDTYQELVKFAEAWPGLTGYNPTLKKDINWVKSELLKRFPGDDPKP